MCPAPAPVARVRPVWMCLLAFTVVAACRAQTPPGAENSRNPPVHWTTDSSLIFVSDTQTPLFFETLVLRTDNNEEATRRIFRAIAADTSCAAVFHLGDIVSMGWSYRSWGSFDDQAAPLLRTHRPFYPTLGNHEYMLWGPTGRDFFADRYPAIAAGWYAKQISGFGVVILNSNFAHLSPGEQETQDRWYESQLRIFDDDTTVAAVIVACHHSPYTNSTVVDPSVEVQQHFVPRFLHSAKARIFLSGHAHAAEHFQIGDKDFVVLGGGGGLLHPLWTGKDRRWTDLFPHEGNRSQFHYVRVQQQPDSILVQIISPGDDMHPSAPAYRFAVPYH